MLRTMHRLLDDGASYGMNLGTVGLLLNIYRPDGLVARWLAVSRPCCIRSRVDAVAADNGAVRALAVNDVVAACIAAVRPCPSADR